MKITDIDIAEILPQQFPFRFVDRLLSYGEVDTLTEYRVSADCLFVEDGTMLESGLVEHMAQSSAARVGYINKYIRGLDVRIGFIGSIRNLKIYRRPAVGEVLVTTVSLVQEIFGISMVNVIVRSGDLPVAEASLKTVELQ